MSLLSELQNKILTAMAKRPFASRQELSELVKKSVSSLNQAIPGLRAIGALTEGFAVNPEWNPLQKYFVFIETKPPKDADAKYQRNFVAKVESTIKNDIKYKEQIYLEDIEIVMGADWDIIAVIRTTNFVHVARFVTEFLRLESEVSGTRTSQVLLKENPMVKERNPDFRDEELLDS